MARSAHISGSWGRRTLSLTLASVLLLGAACTGSGGSAKGQRAQRGDRPAAVADNRQVRVSELSQMEMSQLEADWNLFVRRDDAWTPVFDELAERVLGADDSGQIWAVVNEGWRVGAYRPVEGWTLYSSAEGWDPGQVRALVTDRLGQVWVTVGEELRRLDPQTGRWETLSAGEFRRRGICNCCKRAAIHPSLTLLCWDCFTQGTDATMAEDNRCTF